MILDERGQGIPEKRLRGLVCRRDSSTHARDEREAVRHRSPSLQGNR